MYGSFAVAEMGNTNNEEAESRRSGVQIMAHLRERTLKDSVRKMLVVEEVVMEEEEATAVEMMMEEEKRRRRRRRERDLNLNSTKERRRSTIDQDKTQIFHQESFVGVVAMVVVVVLVVVVLLLVLLPAMHPDTQYYPQSRTMSHASLFGINPPNLL